MPFPAILAALGRGAAVAARAAVQAAVSAGRAGLQVAATGARSLGQGAASIAKGAVNVARGGASSAVGAVKSAATTTATRIAAVANPASLQAAAKSAIQAASSTASAAGQSANSAAGSVGRAGQQASQQLGQFARNAMQNMQQTAQAAISRAGGAQIGGTPPETPEARAASAPQEAQMPGSENGDTRDPLSRLNPLINELTRIPKKIKDFGDALIENRRALLDYNGSIAETVARLDANRIQRNIQLASGTAQSSRYQSEAHDRLESALLPTITAITNATNRIIGALEHVMASGAEKASSAIVGAINGAVALFGKESKKAKEEEKTKEMPINSFLGMLQNGQVFKRNMPPIHKRPGMGDSGPKT